MKSGDMVKLIEQAGWVWISTKGSHHQYRHPTKQGKVTIPHPKKSLPKGTVNAILKQAGLK